MLGMSAIIPGRGDRVRYGVAGAESVRESKPAVETMAEIKVLFLFLPCVLVA